MEHRKLGINGPVVSAISLGCMGMSDFYGPADRSESIATIHAALDAGVTMLDTGDFYGMGDNEMLIREALQGRKREDVFIAVKFGALRDPRGQFIGFDLRPPLVKTFLTYTLNRLGTDYIDLYMPCRVDRSLPIEETIGAMSDLVKAGFVRHLGLSEAGPDNIRRAHAVHTIAALQIEYSLITRGIEVAILPTVRELGISITAYGVLGRGLLTRSTNDPAPQGRDFRRMSPRFKPENIAQNLSLAEELRKLADQKGVTAAQLALAWALAKGTDIVPLVGARRRGAFAESLGALQVQLKEDELQALEQAVPADRVAGSRYDADQMAWLDSERKAN